jgi:hypothetical protein
VACGAADDVLVFEVVELPLHKSHISRNGLLRYFLPNACWVMKKKTTGRIAEKPLIQAYLGRRPFIRQYTDNQRNANLIRTSHCKPYQLLGIGGFAILRKDEIPQLTEVEISPGCPITPMMPPCPFHAL